MIQLCGAGDKRRECYRYRHSLVREHIEENWVAIYIRLASYGIL